MAPQSARMQADQLKRKFLQTRPNPDPRVAPRWAELRHLFSEDGLKDAAPVRRSLH